MSAERVVRCWASAYLYGLPGPVRAERLAELDSDLWEHRRAAGSGRGASLAILARCARGAGADVDWRLARSTPASIVRAATWSLAIVSYALLVAVHAWLSTGLLGTAAVHGDPDDVAYVGRVSATIVVLLVGGAVLMRARARLGAALVAAGAIATPLLYGWAAPVAAPVALAVVGAAVSLARRPAGC